MAGETNTDYNGWHSDHRNYRVRVNDANVNGDYFGIFDIADSWANGSINKAVKATADINGIDTSGYDGTWDLIGLIPKIKYKLLYGHNGDAKGNTPLDTSSYRGYPTFYLRTGYFDSYEDLSIEYIQIDNSTVTIKNIANTTVTCKYKVSGWNFNINYIDNNIDRVPYTIMLILKQYLQFAFSGGLKVYICQWDDLNNVIKEVDPVPFKTDYFSVNHLSDTITAGATWEEDYYFFIEGTALPGELETVLRQGLVYANNSGAYENPKLPVVLGTNIIKSITDYSQVAISQKQETDRNLITYTNTALGYWIQSVDVFNAWFNDYPNTLPASDYIIAESLVIAASSENIKSQDSTCPKAGAKINTGSYATDEAGIHTGFEDIPVGYWHKVIDNGDSTWTMMNQIFTTGGDEVTSLQDNPNFPPTSC